MSQENEKHDLDALAAEDAEFRKLFGALKKVEAPADFDFRLKARIAAGKPSAASSRYGWALRLAFPVIAVFAISTFLVYSLMRTDVGDLAINEVPAIEKASVQPANLPAAAPSQSVAPASNVAAASPTVPVAGNVARITPADENIVAKRTPLQERRDAAEEGGGSIDSSVKPADEAKSPPMAAPRVGSVTPSVNQKAVTLTVRDVLSFNGIAVELDGQKWVVRSVTPNSVGEGSGIRQNDVIEAIDDQPIGSETVFTKSLDGRSLTITRAGLRSRILLRIRH